MGQLIIPSGLVLACQSQDMLGDGNLTNSAYQATGTPITLTCASAKLPAYSAINDASMEFEAVLEQASGTGTAAMLMQIVFSDLDGSTNAVTIQNQTGFAPTTASAQVIRLSCRIVMCRGVNGNGDEVQPIATFQCQSFGVNGVASATQNSTRQLAANAGLANLHRDQRVQLNVNRTGVTGGLLQVRHGQIRLLNGNMTTLV
jgi:hypothetical protein